MRSICLHLNNIVRYTINNSLSDFLLKSQTPVKAHWSLPSIDLRVIALHPSCVNLRMPLNASLVPLTSKPIRVNVFSYVIYKEGNSQYPEQNKYARIICHLLGLPESRKQNPHDRTLNLPVFFRLKHITSLKNHPSSALRES